VTAPLLVVAGAGQSLGRSLVILALKRGYRGLALSRTAAHLDSLRIDAQSPLLEVAAVDLTDGEATEAIITATAQRTPVRTLVHGAATWLGGSDVFDNDIELYRLSFDANFFSALHAIKPVLAN
jgi:NAD(P)-dependent dehydrogenase (short-subunit alcohol dehydrogenase family)